MIEKNSTISELKKVYKNSKFLYKGILLRDEFVFVLPKYKIIKIITSAQDVEKIRRSDAEAKTRESNYQKYRTKTRYDSNIASIDIVLQCLDGFDDHQKAKDLLFKIGNDIGIKQIMLRRAMKVNKLIELHPDQKEILGYNENKGQVIALRLRTDDLTGFRHYKSIIVVMLHELSHNVISGHDSDFHALNRELNKEWNAYQGQMLRPGKNTLNLDPIISGPQALGGRNMVGIHQRDILFDAAMKRLSKEEHEVTEKCGLK